MSQPITANKNELLAILQTNRAKHREVFEAACDGYQKQARAWLEENLRLVKAGKRPGLTFGHFPPQDHTRDYDRVIRALGLHTEDTYVMDDRDVAQYVMDDFSWKRQFLDTSNTYAAATVMEVYGAEAEGD
jgi:hypothetical protein